MTKMRITTAITAPIAFTVIFVFILAIGVTDGAMGQEDLVIRGSVAKVVDRAVYTWTPQNFAGFYYDLDEDVGTENLTVNVSNGAVEKSDAVYTTSARQKDLDFEGWGSFWSMGFLGEEHFAGYEAGFLRDESDGMTLLDDEKLGRILIDKDEEKTLGGSERLYLEEDYWLELDEIDLNADKVYLKLFKDGIKMDSAVVEPSKDNVTLADRTYVYTRLVKGEDVVFIAVHFKNAFISTRGDLVTINGIWQISEETVSVKVDEDWDRMKVLDLDPENMSLTMTNEDESIGLSRDRDISLMGGIRIRTADQDVVSKEIPLRFYLYAEADSSEVDEVRGSVVQVKNGTFLWNNSNFAGFYYDLDDDVGRESLLLNFTGGRIEEGSGAVYVTWAQEEVPEFEDWGKFWTIAFLGERYFAGYGSGLLYDESEEPNMLSHEQLTKVLLNKDKKAVISTDDPIRLEDGYKLVLESVDSRGDKAYLALFRDGDEVDSSVVEFASSSIEDETYTYSRRVGGADDVVVIAVHFRKAFTSRDDGFAEIDGVWQISEETIEVDEGDDYEKMTVDDVSSSDMKVVMTNQDYEIALWPDDEIILMGDIGIRTADQVVSEDEPLRLYVYKRLGAGDEDP